MIQQKYRILYADFLRIVATYAVIILYVAASKWNEVPVTSFNWNVFNVYDSLVRWAVPIFVMLSGMFFLDPERKITFKEIKKRYILRIVLALVFWGLFYRIFDILKKCIIMQESFSINYVVTALAKFLFGPPWYHLWYLYMLIGLYILTPIYRLITENATEWQLKYILVLFFLFGLCLPFIKQVLLNINDNLVINFGLPELVNYSGYYFAGYYFSKYSVTRKIKKIIYIGACLSFIITILGTALFSIKSQQALSFFYNYLSPMTMFESYMIFIYFQRFDKLLLSGEKVKLVTELSKCTFGIYLIYDFIRSFFSKIGLSSDFINPILAVPITSMIIFLISFGLIYFLRKIPFSKYIM